jgi:hypothetical protein
MAELSESELVMQKKHLKNTISLESGHAFP